MHWYGSTKLGGGVFNSCVKFHAKICTPAEVSTKVAGVTFLYSLCKSGYGILCVLTFSHTILIKLDCFAIAPLQQSQVSKQASPKNYITDRLSFLFVYHFILTYFSFFILPFLVRLCNRSGNFWFD